MGLGPCIKQSMRLRDRSLLTIASVLCWAAVAQSAQLEWEFDQAHSSAGFAVRHMMVSTVRGQFSKLTGRAVFDPAQPEQAKVYAEVEVASIDTGNAKRDEHLRSADFFDAPNHPVMRFESTAVKKVGPGRYQMTGNLTIRGITRPVTFDVEGVLEQPVKDPQGNLRAGATATTKINRKDFGIVWNRVLETGGFVVGDEVTITVDVELVHRKP